MADIELLKKLYDKQEKISENISDIKVTLGKQEENIAHHIKRTDLLEENIKLLKDELTPVKEHVNRVEGALKLLGGVGVFATIGKFIYETIIK
jgi:hypothetical protein